jgi:protein-S-isoprenylcysteine O-methyltransferase Ste14
MRRSTAVITSIGWFAVAAGVGAVLVPWWPTGWRLRHPLPYWGAPATLGMLLIVAGLIPAVHMFVQFVRAGGTPMPGAVTRRLLVTGLNRYVRNPIHLGAVAIFLGEALLFRQMSVLVYAIAAWVGAAAFVHWYEEPALARRFGSNYRAGSGRTTRNTGARFPPGGHGCIPDRPTSLTSGREPGATTKMLPSGASPDAVISLPNRRSTSGILSHRSTLASWSTSLAGGCS